MNTNNLGAIEPRQLGNRSDGARVRSSLLVVVGVSLAIAGAVLAVAAGPEEGVGMTVGLGLFLVGALTSLAFAERGLSLLQAERNDGVARQDHPREKSGPGRSLELSSMQLGPDPEQVTGRQTGARI